MSTHFISYPKWFYKNVKKYHKLRLEFLSSEISMKVLDKSSKQMTRLKTNVEPQIECSNVKGLLKNNKELNSKC